MCGIIWLIFGCAIYAALLLAAFGTCWAGCVLVAGWDACGRGVLLWAMPIGNSGLSAGSQECWLPLDGSCL